MTEAEEIARDLRAEYAEVDALVGDLGKAQWTLPTPAEGWSIRDQVTHLSWTDQWMLLSIQDPERFLDGALEFRDPDAEIEKGLRLLDGVPTAEVLDRWRTGREELVAALIACDPDLKIPWFGVYNTPVQQLMGRAMEAFAHGTDIADTVGTTLSHPSLKHVVRHGVETRQWSFATNGLDVPSEDVRVQLHGPGGAVWTYGSIESRDRLSGPATDFALVTVRRRHRADTDLRPAGPVADRWLDVAQSYTGASGSGRKPGQFKKTAATR
ncbi:TIGR03084 family metal-binding protein [Amycolatopsis sp. GA6-003]|uniref:TIGR03084 family metal-binding protein n=1 Tax=Amycolatopsis sp. GA6-003 TaxID=2652444 RepID=UPI0039172695